MNNTLIFVGGPSASGKTTFAKVLNDCIPNSILYRRLDAFSDCAKIINCSKDKMFEYVSSLDADKQFAQVCYENDCIISDIHYALQANRDFKCSDSSNNLYTSTISNELITDLLNKGINIIAVHLTCDEQVLYARALRRFQNGERGMRAKSLEDVILQKKYERIKWIELSQKHNIFSIEFDSQHLSSVEMTEQFLNTISKNNNVKTLIKKY